MKAPILIRKDTKELALSTLRTVSQMPTFRLVSTMTQYNGWRHKTNLTILQELSAAGFVLLEDGNVRLVK